MEDRRSDADPTASSAPLLDRAREGDSTALDDLVARHLPGLEAYLRRHVDPALRAKESCADLAQSTCREVLQDSGRFEYRGEAAFRTWLYNRALMKVMDRAKYYRAQKRDVAREQPVPGTSSAPGISGLAAGGQTPSLHAIQGENLDRLEAAFDELPEDYRQVISLTQLAGLSHHEAAAQMGRTPKATRNLLHRALARLASRIAEQEDGH